MYSWFQKYDVLCILVLIFLNFWVLRVINSKDINVIFSKILFIVAITFNISYLIFFKTVSTSNLIHSAIVNIIPGLQRLDIISYPVGLSFITFQVLSTLIDYRRSEEYFSCSIWDYMTYIFMFPKITMGPITRFKSIFPQLSNLNPPWDNIQAGSKRFIIGLAKKVIIADQLATVVNAGFNLPKPAFPTSIAWLLLISFMIQIYYDFSGYIDMGIGLAKIMGIDFPENFNSPYVSLNITEFWRRWHMTLTSWFRDYVFYPLEFSRRRVKKFRQTSNTIFVFLLTGLWHGLTMNYLIWGVLQGMIISFENSKYGRLMKATPIILQRFYFFIMILGSWVFFRSNSLVYALRFFKRLIIFDQSVYQYPFSMSQPLPLINNSIIIVLIIGFIGLLPIKEYWAKIVIKKPFNDVKCKPIYLLIEYIICVILFIMALAFLTSQNFVPSIYGKY